MSVFANAGDDVFAVGNRDVSSNIRGDLFVHGGFGDDTLMIDDNDGTPGTHSLSADTYTKSTATGIVKFQFVQDVRLETGAGADAVDVLGTSEDFDFALSTNGGNDNIRIYAVDEATTVTIDTGGGDDAIEVAPKGRTLDTIGGNLVLHGGIGTDTATINDQNDLGNDYYEVTTNQVSKPGFLGFLLLYDGMEALVEGQCGKNTIDSHSTLPGWGVIVNAGAGNDTIRLSPVTKNLGQVLGNVWVNGQADFDTVLAHDEAIGLGATYTLSRSKFGRPGFGSLTFDTIERLQLNMGSGNDTAASRSSIVMFAPWQRYGYLQRHRWSSAGRRPPASCGAPARNWDQPNVVYVSRRRCLSPKSNTSRTNLCQGRERSPSITRIWGRCSTFSTRAWKT